MPASEQNADPKELLNFKRGYDFVIRRINLIKQILKIQIDFSEKNADKLAQGFYGLKLKHKAHLMGSLTEAKASGSNGDIFF